MSVSSLRSRGDEPFQNAPAVGMHFFDVSGQGFCDVSQQIDTTTEAANADQFDMSLGVESVAGRIANLLRDGEAYKALEQFFDFMNSDAVSAEDKIACIEIVAVDLVETVDALDHYLAADLALAIENHSQDPSVLAELESSVLEVVGGDTSLLLDDEDKPVFVIDPLIAEIARAKQAVDEIRRVQACMHCSADAANEEHYEAPVNKAPVTPTFAPPPPSAA